MMWVSAALAVVVLFLLIVLIKVMTSESTEESITATPGGTEPAASAPLPAAAK